MHQMIGPERPERANRLPAAALPADDRDACEGRALTLPAGGRNRTKTGEAHWALRRGGVSTEHIARRTVAFFFLTSLANVGGVIVFAVLYATGILDHDRNPALTHGFGAAAMLATAIVVIGIPRLSSRGSGPS